MTREELELHQQAQDGISQIMIRTTLEVSRLCEERNLWEKRARKAGKLLRKLAARYVKEDGSPGDLSCCWGWRDMARSLRWVADEVEKGWKEEE